MLVCQLCSMMVLLLLHHTARMRTHAHPHAHAHNRRHATLRQTGKHGGGNGRRHGGRMRVVGIHEWERKRCGRGMRASALTERVFRVRQADTAFYQAVLFCQSDILTVTRYLYCGYNWMCEKDVPHRSHTNP